MLYRHPPFLLYPCTTLLPHNIPQTGSHTNTRMHAHTHSHTIPIQLTKFILFVIGTTELIKYRQNLGRYIKSHIDIKEKHLHMCFRVFMYMSTIIEQNKQCLHFYLQEKWQVNFHRKLIYKEIIVIYMMPEHPRSF